MHRTTLTRRVLLAGTLLAGGNCARAAGRTALLYQARTIVTGMRAETRLPGLARCLPQVLIRVSGDDRLALHPGLAAFAETPEFAVKTWYYRDLYAFRPIRDEQGTRDRPYEMTVEYIPERINELLADLGSDPWLAERPRIVVFLGVRHIASSFMLTSTEDRGDLMRESFKDAAWAAAMEVVIPPEAAVRAANLSVETMQDTDPRQLMAFVDTKTGQLPLAGTLHWSREHLAWEARWRLFAGGKDHRWEIAGVNFDAAFRNGVGGAARILSGRVD